MDCALPFGHDTNSRPTQAFSGALPLNESLVGVVVVVDAAWLRCSKVTIKTTTSSKGGGGSPAG